MQIVLAGAGGFALEIEQYILDCKRAGQGLVDADGREPAYNQVVIEGVYFSGLGRMGDFQSHPPLVPNSAERWPSEFHFLIAIGDPEVRRKVWKELQERGVRFATLVHPSAVVASNARLGVGATICPFVFIGPMAKVGRNVAVNTYASIGHDSTIGDHTVFSPYSCVNGIVSLGESCFLGSGAIVTPNRQIGAFSKITAGSVVTTDIESGSLAHGNPAKSRRMFRFPVDFAT